MIPPGEQEKLRRQLDAVFHLQVGQLQIFVDLPVVGIQFAGFFVIENRQAGAILLVITIAHVIIHLTGFEAAIDNLAVPFQRGFIVALAVGLIALLKKIFGAALAHRDPEQAKPEQKDNFAVGTKHRVFHQRYFPSLESISSA